MGLLIFTFLASSHFRVSVWKWKSLACSQRIQTHKSLLVEKFQYELHNISISKDNVGTSEAQHVTHPNQTTHSHHQLAARLPTYRSIFTTGSFKSSLKPLFFSGPEWKIMPLLVLFFVILD